MSRTSVVLAATMALFGPIDLKNSPDRTLVELAERPAVKAALAAARMLEPQTIESQVKFSEIPAPSFKEGARGEELRRAFVQLGLRNVRVDRAGNVLGDRPGAAAHPHVVVAAHLDTVFPEGTPVKVKRDGAVLRGPGIGDDSRGLAVLTGIIRALSQASVQTDGPITFVADVGEEGLGDLRGMKELFDVTLKGTIDQFITIDGTGLGVAHTFVGSRRYRVTYRGPGGHSFGAFGVPNPIDAIGRAVAKISAIQVPAEPRTTFNVGRIGGGTSVNSIPVEAWMELDLRSVATAQLAALETSVQRALSAALSEENARWRSPGTLTMTRQVVGERAAAETPAGSMIVQAALSATRAVGASPVSTVSSSDANYPASLGIPAIEIGGGGRGTDAHAPTEAFDSSDSWLGTQRALLLTIALAQK